MALPIQTRFIIEHLEPGSTLEDWATTEYAHCAQTLLPAKSASLILTGLGRQGVDKLPHRLKEIIRQDKATHQQRLVVIAEPIDQILDQLGLSKDEICLLDPAAKQELTPQDGEAFKAFLFGGILGDDPPRDRTSYLRAMGFPTRHLGPMQMTTDTAIGVTARVVLGQELLNSGVKAKQPLETCLTERTKLLQYIDVPEIQLGHGESVTMPFRYLDAAFPAPWYPSRQTGPLLAPGMLSILRADLDKDIF